MKFSQLRQDLVSGDWIVIAPKRRLRPHEMRASKSRVREPKPGCVFENPKQALLEIRDGKDWTVRIIENRFPAFVHRDICSAIRKVGPYAVTDGIGHHDILITRDHNQDFPDLSLSHARDLFRAFQDRYLMLMADSCLAYISMFHNWGAKAGASVYHPHYQMIAIPVVPPDFEHSLKGAIVYSKKHRNCVHCAMIDWERKQKKRIIFENAGAIAFTPFLSRSGFEVRVFPKRHLPFFEHTREEELDAIVEALHAVLRMVKRSLHDPDYNFFIHTAPLAHRKEYKNYHWHIEVLPKVNISAGFELGTGIEINPVDPDDAAKILRGRR
jgi:UDPglucose--hexose-1-phosphate uridylyltransferase